MRAAALALLIAALATGEAGSQTPQGRFRPSSAQPRASEVEAEIIQQANAFRRQNGLRGLAENELLTDEARVFAGYLARTGKFSHTADGRDPAARAEAAGYAYCEVAENLARLDENGALVDRISDRLMAGWERSPGHRHNLLDAMVTETGVGVATPPGRQDSFIAVQVFGRPLSARYAFQVANRADRPVGYAFDGQRRTIAPSTTVTYTVCTPTVLVFDGIAGRFPAGPGAIYRLSSEPMGGLSVTVRPPVENAAAPPEN